MEIWIICLHQVLSPQFCFNNPLQIYYQQKMIHGPSNPTCLSDLPYKVFLVDLPSVGLPQHRPTQPRPTQRRPTLGLPRPTLHAFQQCAPSCLS